MGKHKFTPTLATTVKKRMAEIRLSDYKIGDSYFQEDHFGGRSGIRKTSGLCCTLTVEPLVDITITAKNLGFKKICRKCKKEFYTERRRSRVICQECKEKIKSRPDQYEKTCPICHSSFISKRSDAQSCPKDSCRKALYRQKKRSNSSPLT
ncbi:hypothetical protein [Methanoregula sp.]|uniref:hypothetical protein n=1 Tax=Methanoregula sp. TaxID=2052170 RepID=UPI003BB17EE3